MKKHLKKIIFLINRNPISKNRYDHEIKQRSSLGLTDIEPLSQHINMFAPFTSEIHPINDWYGHATILKNYLGLPQNYQFKFVIEHGLYLSSQIADYELESNLPTFITYSPYRKKVFKKILPAAFDIGPFIHYANHYLTKPQLEKEKKRLGKTLLFFPSHSLVGLNTDYDMDWSYQKIQTLAKKFDSVRVCLYWKDILRGKHRYYQQKGFECVSAGHILDPNFLPRVKSIIETADLTVSNDASSPLSYCIYQSKPHIIFYQRGQMSGTKYLKEAMTRYWQSKPYNRIVKEFSKVGFRISSKQRQLMNYYCGHQSTKTKSQLLKIVNQSEQIFKGYR